MKIKLYAFILAVALSFGRVDAQESIQYLPANVDLSIVAVSEDYLKAELGSEFVEYFFEGEYGRYGRERGVGSLHIGRDGNVPPYKRSHPYRPYLGLGAWSISYRVLEHPKKTDGDFSYYDGFGSVKIGGINTVAISPVLDLPRIRGPESAAVINKIHHLNANVLFAAWVYQGREMLKN